MKKIHLLTIYLILFFVLLSPARCYASDGSDTSYNGDVVTICIDPGHGGENEGALWKGYTEKEMTLITAEAMRDELEKYDGIRVIMTRTKDVDLTLEERVKIASEAGAEFFFCLHYNMSEEHDMYGCECWISAFGENYAKGRDFADIEMKLLTDTGLYDRGVKTRLNSKGTNYYGVLRIADLEDIPGIIIEHCHLDHEEDEPFYDEHDLLVEYGKLDATAVAMYYGLKSDELGKDFTGYTYEHTPVPDSVVKPDSTEPESVTVTYEEPEYTDDHYSIKAGISSYDPDCRMLYYSYSTDGGAHFSRRYNWESTDGTEADERINVELALPSGRDIYLVVRTYNLYNLHIDSEAHYIQALEEPEIEEETDPTEEYADYTDIERKDEMVHEDKRALFSDKSIAVMLLFMAVSILIMSILMACIIIRNAKHKNRRRRN